MTINRKELGELRMDIKYCCCLSGKGTPLIWSKHYGAELETFVWAQAVVTAMRSGFGAK